MPIVKRIIFFTAFLGFLVFSIIFSLPQPITTHPYRSTDLEKAESEGLVEYRLNGVLTYAANLHYARMTTNQTTTQPTTPDNTTTVVDGDEDEEGAVDAGVVDVGVEETREVLEQYFDEHGNQAKQSAGHYALKRTYTNNQNTVITYLNADLQPMINTSGYCTRVREFKDGVVVAEWYKGLNGESVYITSGVAGRLNAYENGRNTIVTYVDEEGQPKNNTSGYAIMKRTFYEEGANKGRINCEYYFDASGNPVALSSGQYGAHKEYDEYGRAVKIDYLGRDGEILWTSIRTFYPDDTVETERYYDREGNPLKKSGGQYGYRKVDGKTIYLDSDGREYQSLNRYLHNEPLMVILIGCVLVFVSWFSSRRVNHVLLVLYILFILFMTLWNRDGESRANWELFWSYKQFFSSTSLRLEILNNIWLFIPLGAILFKLCPRVGVLLIAVGLSIVIEIVQYFTGLGLCELDDVISNGLGAAVGFGFGYALEPIVKRFMLNADRV